MKICAVCLAALLIGSGARNVFAEDNGADHAKPEEVIGERKNTIFVDTIAGEVSDGPSIGTRKSPESAKKDPVITFAERLKKMRDELRSGALTSGGGVFGEGGVTHVIDYQNGNMVVREYYTEACNVSTTGSEINGVNQTVTTIKGDKGKLLETIVWKQNEATIKDKNGKVIEVIKF